MTHRRTGDCFAGACEICNPPEQYRPDPVKRIEELEAQLEAQQPYLRHKSNCDFYHTYANGQDGKCDCGLKAAINGERDE